MRQFIILFNHTLTKQQQDDAKRILGVSGFISPPLHLKEKWRQIPADLDDISAYLSPLIQWLEQEMTTGDFLLIQGDFGASFYIADWAIANGFIPIYSTTKRIARENQHDNGHVSLQHQFYHVHYRKYKRWSPL